jgi:hypothetical protein
LEKILEKKKFINSDDINNYTVSKYHFIYKIYINIYFN